MLDWFFYGVGCCYNLKVLIIIIFISAIGEAELAQAKLKGLENETCAITPNARAARGNNMMATPNNQQTSKLLVGGQLTADQLKFNPLKEQMDARNRMPATDIEKVEEAKYKLLQKPESNKNLVVDDSQFRYAIVFISAAFWNDFMPFLNDLRTCFCLAFYHQYCVI